MIGIDIVEHKRVNLSIAKKVLADKELEQYNNLDEVLKIEYLASRFAVKEAVIKATNKEFTFDEIEVIRTKGKPKINIEGLEISISHEKKYTVAVCLDTRKK